MSKRKQTVAGFFCGRRPGFRGWGLRTENRPFLQSLGRKRWAARMISGDEFNAGARGRVGACAQAGGVAGRASKG